MAAEPNASQAASLIGQAMRWLMRRAADPVLVDFVRYYYHEVKALHMAGKSSEVLQLLKEELST
eukprot:CAMPEP_0119112092 /NCGR_PEP_ID=MMETSP1180-20130426/38794_1 /TAXON_ID=3052 ORGANISM="Chlamydomonas cf sp, Strain CCMP681" /NCGR_SAMPLE_ID=MMETSP1180 /ASSEMBLY_ACC=CAM_ASM_000741 /LENGTH=63 /DNA_ID=CAMNT_0007099441 /DNA_START=20 /DNA_END=211 /DNA_ORIENTATION=+